MKVTKEFRDASEADLQEKLKEFKKELLKLNVEAASGVNPSSPGKLRQTKKNIARILTILKEKEVKSK